MANLYYRNSGISGMSHFPNSKTKEKTKWNYMKNFIIENKFEVKDSVVKFYGISKTTIESILWRANTGKRPVNLLM